MDNLSHSSLPVWVMFITLALTCFSVMFPEIIAQVQYPILFFLLLSIGLPHGATDFMLFRQMQGKKISVKKVLQFFFRYISIMLVFLFLWLWIPMMALTIFIIFSCYHFGQSNWEKTGIPPKYEHVSNLLWGTFAVGGPVLWHWQESKTVIGQVIGFIPDISFHWMQMIQVCFLLFNAIFLGFLSYRGFLSPSRTKEEFLKLVVLSGLFYFTPMIVGFAVYFGLWHSLSSLWSQLSLFRKKCPDFSLYDYYRQAIPYTLLAVLGLVFMVWVHSHFLPGVSIISTFLIFIGSITLPHVVLMDEIYQKSS